MNIRGLLKNRVIKNASWIIVCRIIQALLNLIVTALTARFLGPDGYGLIGYAASILAFLGPVAKLGMGNTLVQEFVQDPDGEGEIIGTTLAICLVSAVFCLIAGTLFVYTVNAGEHDTLIVCSLYNISLFFQILELTGYWFQAKLLSKYSSVVGLIAYTVVSAYKIYLLASRKSVYWFALSNALDAALIAVMYLVLFRKLSRKKLTVSWKRVGSMLASSKYYIITDLMVVIFAQTDKMMLKIMISNAEEGFYNAAVMCAGMTGFVFSAIIDSSRPAILSAKKESEKKFENAMVLTYGIIIYLSLAQSIITVLLSRWIVGIMYGPEYAETAAILRILVWYTTFAYLGAVRNIWILAEGQQKYLMGINLSGALMNVGLNYILIPGMGACGAAVASLVTQFFTNVVVSFFVKPTYRSIVLMAKGLNPFRIIGFLKGGGRIDG